MESSRPSNRIGFILLGIPLLRCELEPSPKYPGQQRCRWVFSNADDKAWEASTDLHATDLVLPWQGMRNAHRYMSKPAGETRRQTHGTPAGSLTHDDHQAA